MSINVKERYAELPNALQKRVTAILVAVERARL
jgi:hypothetical protein